MLGWVPLRAAGGAPQVLPTARRKVCGDGHPGGEHPGDGPSGDDGPPGDGLSGDDPLGRGPLGHGLSGDSPPGTCCLASGAAAGAHLGAMAGRVLPYGNGGLGLVGCVLSCNVRRGGGEWDFEGGGEDPLRPPWVRNGEQLGLRDGVPPIPGANEPPGEGTRGRWAAEWRAGQEREGLPSTKAVPHEQPGWSEQGT